MLRYLSFRQFGMIFAEMFLLIGCVFAGYFFHLREVPPTWLESCFLLGKAVLIAVIFQVSLHLNDVYNFQGSRFSRDFAFQLFQGLILANGIIVAFFYIKFEVIFSRAVLAYSLVLGDILVIIWHTILYRYLNDWSPHTNLLILGTSGLAGEIVKELKQHPELGIQIIGFVDDDSACDGIPSVDRKIIGGYEDLAKIVAAYNVNQIVVGLRDRRGKLPVKELLELRTKGIAIDDATNFYERITGKIPIENLKPGWLIFGGGFEFSKRVLLEKRIFSLVISSVLLVLTSPIILLTMILIKLDSKGPVFYRQERVGLNGRTFMLVKFRSMRQDAEQGSGPVWSVAGDSRVTRVGRILRRTRIDELPQFYNVFRGEMSLVGPRPERPYFVKQLSEEIPYYPLRHAVRPGITGWAQIKYQYASTLEHTIEKLQYDLFYIKNSSWVLDTIIVFETIKTVLVRQGS